MITTSDIPYQKAWLQSGLLKTGMFKAHFFPRLSPSPIKAPLPDNSLFRSPRERDTSKSQSKPKTPVSHPVIGNMNLSDRTVSVFRSNISENRSTPLTSQPPILNIVAGDQIEFTVSGAYFSGAPLNQQNVKYSLYSSNYYEYEYLFNNQNLPSGSKYYGYWNGNKIQDGELTLNGTGQASFLVPSSDGRYKSSRSQIFSFEVQFTDESGNPVLARKNILVYPAEFNIYRRSGFYTGQTNRPFVLPIIVKSIRGSRINDLRLTAGILRESWIALPLTPGQKYPTYVKETENLSSSVRHHQLPW